MDARINKWRVYGKDKGQKRFAPMDLNRGIQVVNLIYASMLSDDERAKIEVKLVNDNPDWKFEFRPI